MKNLLQKILIICSLILPVLCCAFSLTSASVYAEPTSNNTNYPNGNSNNNYSTSTGSTNTSSGVNTSGCRNILGLVAWDCNVNLGSINNEDTLTSSVWTIVANVAMDLTVIATYLILGYVIYGGYLYIFSSGEPGKIATSKKTLTQAFIGLAIVMSANVIMNTIRIALGGANLGTNCATSECVNPGDMVTSFIQWIVAVAGIVAVIFVVYGGISYITSAGDPNKLQKAKNIILYALIGLVIVALAEIITAFVSNLIREANSQTSLIETVKEYHETDQIS